MTTEKRLIDADALMKYINETHSYAGLPMAAHICTMELLTYAPIVDAVKVVHAEWLDIQFDPMWRSMLATCSHCKVRGEVRVKSNECGFAVPDSDYCPHCGAKMDGGINK